MSDEEKLPDNSVADATAYAESHRAEKDAESYPAEIIPMESELEKELGHLLNRHSAENESGTPDFILAMFLTAQLDLFNQTIKQRAVWRGESVELPALQQLHRDTETMDRVIAFLRSKVEEGVIDIKTPIEATDLYRDLMDYRSPEAPDLEQSPDVDLEKWEPQEDTVYAPGALEANDGKEVLLVTYTDGQRNEIGTAMLHVTPGEVRVTGTITGAVAQFADHGSAYSIDTKDDSDYPLQEPKDEPPKPTGRFARYQQEGLSQ